MRWHFSGRYGNGKTVVLSYKIVPSKWLRERLGLDDIISVLQQSLRWYGHVLQKEDKDWVKKHGRHNDFESGGYKFASGASENFFWTPPLLAYLGRT